jgi:hypothetical protein
MFIIIAEFSWGYSPWHGQGYGKTGSNMPDISYKKGKRSIES